MPLNVSLKPGSNTSSTPSVKISRSEVSFGAPKGSTARVEALKTRLNATPPSQPIAPRPAGSSARREEMAKLNKFTSSPQSPTPAVSNSRSIPNNLGEIAPPPSGLAPGSVESAPGKTVEAPQKTLEASNETLSPQLVALTRKEQQLRKAQKELKAAQDAWKQEQANYIPRSALTSDTLKVLSEAGITADKLVELQINQATPQDPNKALLDKISALEKQLQDVIDPENGTLAQRDKSAYTQAVSQIRDDAKLLVESNPAFETIKSENKTEDVVELITGVFDEEGIILDVEEAAQLVEDKLVEHLTRQFDRISKYQKIKAKTGQQAELAEATNAQLEQKDSPKINTLTNAGSSMRPLSARDRAVLKVQAAIEAAKGR